MLAKNLAIFCLCSKDFSKVIFERNGLISLVDKILRSLHIHAKAWVLINALTKVSNEKDKRLGRKM